MLVLYASLSVLGSVMTALAPVPGLFVAGHILQGLTTSLMLIAAVPPLVIGWPTSKMPWTAVTMNLCVFGAVALGPVIGGLQAAAGAWRPLFWIVAGLSALALLFVVLTFEDQPPADRTAPWDMVAIVLAGGGSAAAFFGASELLTHPLLSVIVLVPLLAGVGAIVALVVVQYRIKHPLMPVRQASTTFPVAGMVIAICAGAASVGVITLAQTGLQTKPPAHVAILFLPEFATALLSAALFGSLFRTRFVPLLAVAGTIMLAAGAAVLAGAVAGSDAIVLVGSGLVGLGVGSSVSPALFIAGFSLRSAQIQRIFALVELLRGFAAFITAPLLLRLAMTASTNPRAGIGTALWVCFGIAAAAGLTATALFVLGRARLRRPDLDRWEQGDEPAWESPPLLARVRGTRRHGDHSASSPTDARRASPTRAS
jgi:hypothetical protein